MKRKTDVLVGAVVLVVVAATIAVAAWVKQADIGQRQQEVVARFRDVGNARVGNAVVVRGVVGGRVQAIELAPVLTGLALAGRVGANIAAELGTMRVTEQIDALETLCYDPVPYLVVPRVLAGGLMFPIVVAASMIVGVGAGWIA